MTPTILFKPTTMYKLLIPLLLMSVQGVAQRITTIETNCVPIEDSIKSIRTTIMRGYGGYWYEDRDTTLFLLDSCDQQKLEIQTLRLLNDSLTKKLQLLLEWQELACPIIESVGVVKTVNGYRLLVNKREMIKPAVRYYKRYKTN